VSEKHDCHVSGKISDSCTKHGFKMGILHFEVKVVDTFIGTKNCKLQKRLIAS